MTPVQLARMHASPGKKSTTYRAGANVHVVVSSGDRDDAHAVDVKQVTSNNCLGDTRSSVIDHQVSRNPTSPDLPLDVWWRHPLVAEPLDENLCGIVC